MKHFLQIPDLPVKLSKHEYCRLMSKLKIEDKQNYHNIITFSLIHMSYAYEKNISSVRKESLTSLQVLGGSLLKLTLYHIFYSRGENLDTNKMNQVVQVIMRELPNRINEDLGITKLAFLGSGASAEIIQRTVESSRIIFNLCLQLLSAVYIVGGYKVVKSFINGYLSKSIDNASPIASYKTLLQEYIQSKKMGAPIYQTINEIGPDHDKIFIVKVSTKNKLAEGKGTSKKKAEENAAKNYIKNNAPQIISNLALIIDNYKKPIFQVPNEHKKAIQEIAKDLDFPASKIHLLSQSLIHVSYSNEKKLRFNNKNLSQLGSVVLEVLLATLVIHQMQFLKILSFQNPKKAIGYFGEASFAIESFKILQLDKYLLMGKAFTKFKITNNMKSDTYQAVIGALFVSREDIGEVETFLPHKIYELLIDAWLNKTKSTTDFSDPKTQLQEFLQAVKLMWHFENSSFGPDHKLEHRSKIKLISEAANKSITLKEGKGHTKKEAEKNLSLLLIQAINKVNNELTGNMKGAFFSFMLHHEIASIPTTLKEKRVWYNAGVLGSQLLITGRMKEFKEWAYFIDSYIKSDDFNVDLEKVYNFYYTLASVVKNKIKNDYIDGILGIRELLDKINPEERHFDVRSQIQFSDILYLSKPIFRGSKVSY